MRGPRDPSATASPAQGEEARQAAAQAIEAFLRAIGYEISGELVGTGRRVADAWVDELVCGEGSDAAAILRAGALDMGSGPHSVVVLRDVAIATMCPHHLLPSHGRATIGYLPARLAAGLGAIAQAADACSRRLCLQESLGEAIVSALTRGLEAHGAFCKLELVHTCFSARGERQAGSIVETLSLRGVFAEEKLDLALALARPSRR